MIFKLKELKKAYRWRMLSLSYMPFSGCRKTATRQSSTAKTSFISSSLLSCTDISYGIRLCTALFFVQSSVKYLFFTCFFRNIAVFQIVYVYVQCTEIFYSILPHCARVPCKIMKFLPSARCDSPRHNESSGIPKRYYVLHEVPAICYCFYP